VWLLQMAVLLRPQKHLYLMPQQALLQPWAWYLQLPLLLVHPPQQLFLLVPF
jgi:hypothetical protein